MKTLILVLLLSCSAMADDWEYRSEERRLPEPNGIIYVGGGLFQDQNNNQANTPLNQLVVRDYQGEEWHEISLLFGQKQMLAQTFCFGRSYGPFNAGILFGFSEQQIDAGTQANVVYGLQGGFDFEITKHSSLRVNVQAGLHLTSESVMLGFRL